jgi:hypothetical protein
MNSSTVLLFSILSPDAINDLMRRDLWIAGSLDYLFRKVRINILQFYQLTGLPELEPDLANKINSFVKEFEMSAIKATA